MGQLSPVSTAPPPFGGVVGSQNTPVFCLSRNVAGVPVATAAFAPDTSCIGTNNKCAQEYRHTIGIDARWTLGAVSLRPTFMYQFGTREQVNPF